MIYQGSKARILEWILPYLQDCIDGNGISLYVEPFVGGANVIDHVACAGRSGSDSNGELISLLRHMQADNSLNGFPEHCSFSHYAEVRESRKRNDGRFPQWYVAGIGYFASYGGRYFDGGYGRDRTGKRDIYVERLAYARKQAPLLNGITFMQASYDSIVPVSASPCLIYCDPPYRGVKTYCNGKFDYEEFYRWASDMGKSHYLLVSEYDMPSDRFRCVSAHGHWTRQRSDRDASATVEKLFTPVGGLYEAWMDKEGGMNVHGMQGV